MSIDTVKRMKKIGVQNHSYVVAEVINRKSVFDIFPRFDIFPKKRFVILGRLMQDQDIGGLVNKTLPNVLGMLHNYLTPMTDGELRACYDAFKGRRPNKEVYFIIPGSRHFANKTNGDRYMIEFSLKNQPEQYQYDSTTADMISFGSFSYN